VNNESGEAFGSLDGLAALAFRIKAPYPKPTPWRAMVLAEGDYNGIGLRPYQQYGILWLKEVLKLNRGAILADDMGLGKTLQSITVAQLVAFQGRILVVAPAAARETWREELAKWAPNQSVAILGPAATKAARLEWDKAPNSKWVVSSYDLVASGKVEDVAFALDMPTLVIIDEAHRAKGRKTKRANALQQLCAQAQYRLALTGTPIWDRPRDLWMLLDILLGGRFGSKWDFDLAYCNASINDHGGWENAGATNTEELRLRLAYYMLRREKAEVATDLPPLTRTVRWLEPDAPARREWEKVQLGLTKGNLHAAIESTLAGKMDEAMELAAESRRFLLFTWLKTHAFQMHKLLNERGIPCELVTGEASTTARQSRIAAARSKGWGVVATLDSASEAINMQGVASQGIMHTIDWVPTKLAQAEARLHRIGQKDPVTWTYLAMKDSVDELIVPAVVNKLDAFIQAMGAQAAQGLRDELNATVGITGVDENSLLAQMAAMLEDKDDE
jgi:SWI/SNF-related matrix-associated actin-dependent regulator 1 of chromatin subfamily A